MSTRFEELVPKTELERAFVQARCWTPSHTWRRATIDLDSGRMVHATGKYLALARTLALEGQFEFLEDTLGSICKYATAVAEPEKQSIVRVLCSMFKEVERYELAGKETIEKHLIRTAVEVTSQIKDKTSLMGAVLIIKHVSDIDAVAERLLEQKIKQLRESVERERENLLMPDGSRMVKAAQASRMLESIAIKAAHLPGQLPILEMLVEVANILLEQDQIKLAKIAANEVISYTEGIVKIDKTEPTSEVGKTLIQAPDRKQYLEEKYTAQYRYAVMWMECADVARDLSQDNVADEALEHANDYKRASQQTQVELILERQRTHRLKRDTEVQRKNDRGYTTNLIPHNVIDQQLFSILSRLADKYQSKDLFVESSDIHSRSLLAQIRLKSLGPHSLQDLVTIASTGVISNQYEETLERLKNIGSLLRLSSIESEKFVDAEMFCDLQNHLFEQLSIRFRGLDERSFTALTYLIQKNINYVQEPLTTQLFSEVTNLLRTRAEGQEIGLIAENLYTLALQLLNRAKTMSPSWSASVISFAKQVQEDLDSLTRGDAAHERLQFLRKCLAAELRRLIDHDG